MRWRGSGPFILQWRPDSVPRSSLSRSEHKPLLPLHWIHTHLTSCHWLFRTNFCLNLFMFPVWCRHHKDWAGLCMYFYLNFESWSKQMTWTWWPWSLSLFCALESSFTSGHNENTAGTPCVSNAPLRFKRPSAFHPFTMEDLHQRFASLRKSKDRFCFYETRWKVKNRAEHLFCRELLERQHAPQAARAPRRAPSPELPPLLTIQLHSFERWLWASLLHLHLSCASVSNMCSKAPEKPQRHYFWGLGMLKKCPI